MEKIKQARLDAYEIKALWPALNKPSFWPIEELINARKASKALFNADIRLCNGTITEERRAAVKNRALKAAEALNKAIFSEVSPTATDCVCDIRRYTGFRYLEVRGGGRDYALFE